MKKNKWKGYILDLILKDSFFLEINMLNIIFDLNIEKCYNVFFLIIVLELVEFKFYIIKLFE